MWSIVRGSSINGSASIHQSFQMYVTLEQFCCSLYNIYDHELLAVMRALDAWFHYLLGSPTMVQVFTDHKNLTYFHQPCNLNHQQARWLLDISEFDLTCEHIVTFSLEPLVPLLFP